MCIASCWKVYIPNCEKVYIVIFRLQRDGKNRDSNPWRWRNGQWPDAWFSFGRGGGTLWVLWRFRSDYSCLYISGSGTQSTYWSISKAMLTVPRTNWSTNGIIFRWCRCVGVYGIRYPDLLVWCEVKVIISVMSHIRLVFAKPLNWLTVFVD